MIRRSVPWVLFVFVVVGSLSSVSAKTSETNILVAARTDAPPDIDGQPGDLAWADAQELVVTVKRDRDGQHVEQDVRLRAVHDGQRLYLLAKWDDSTNDQGHHTRLWDQATNKYVDAGDREDHFAVEWPISDSFSACMLAGVPYHSDVWHWKACRTNPTGYAHDKHHYISREKLSDHASRWETKKGVIYIDRPSDQGQPPFRKQATPTTNQGPRIPRYVSQTPTGSQADVLAKGHYHNSVASGSAGGVDSAGGVSGVSGGGWTLELARNLNTGNDDDATLSLGQPHRFAIAVFDHEDDEDHRTSPELVLQLAK